MMSRKSQISITNASSYHKAAVAGWTQRAGLLTCWCDVRMYDVARRVRKSVRALCMLRAFISTRRSPAFAVRRLLLIVVMTDDCDEHHITHEEHFIPITLLVLHFIIQVAITLPFIPSYF